MVFWFEDELCLFTGDVVIGDGSTVVIAPPGGDMRAYQATLHRLRDEFTRAARIYGGHGEEIEEPQRVLDYYIAHREKREAELIATLQQQGRQTVPQIVEHVYRATPQALWPAAARQMFAYLIALEREGRVVAHPLDRDANDFERTILDPDLSRIVDSASRAVAVSTATPSRSHPYNHPVGIVEA